MFLAKRKIKLLILFTLIILNFGCSKKVEYHGDLGFQVFDLGIKNIKFNIYHSNGSDGNWEKIDSIDVSVEELEGNFKYLDVSVSSEKQTVNIEVFQKGVTKDNGAEIILSKEIESTSFEIKDLETKILNFSQKEISYTPEKEQIFLLYPVSNKKTMTIFPDISLEKPYDPEKINIDNILITVIFSKK